MAPETNKQSVFPTDNDEMKNIFKRFDANGDGKICEDELVNVLKSLGSNTFPDEVKRIMSEVDADSDGFVSLDEFVIFCKGIAGESEGDGKDDLKEAFKYFDFDNSDFYKRVASDIEPVRENYTLESCKNMIKSVGSDVDGFVDFEEFQKMMSRNSGAGAS